MGLEEPDTATSVYKQYLIWKITCLKIGVHSNKVRMEDAPRTTHVTSLVYYERLLREHNLRWAPFEN